MHKIIATACCFALITPACALASAAVLPGTPPIPPTQIHFATTANYRVADTDLHATLSVQASGADQARIAAQVNQTVSWATTQVLASIHGMKWHTVGYTTQPLSTRKQPLPDANPWRVQETIVVESTDPAALLPLLGTLQSRMHLEGLNYTAAPKSISQAENHAGVAALRRFLSEAKQDCAALGLPGTPHLGNVNLQTGSFPITARPYPMMMTAAREAPGPVVAHPGVASGVVTASGAAYCR